MSFDVTDIRKIDAALLATWIHEIKLGNQAAATQLVRHYEPAEPDAIRKKLTRAIDRAANELGLLEDGSV